MRLRIPYMASHRSRGDLFIEGTHVGVEKGRFRMRLCVLQAFPGCANHSGTAWSTMLSRRWNSKSTSESARSVPFAVDPKTRTLAPPAFLMAARMRGESDVFTG